MIAIDLVIEQYSGAGKSLK